MIQELKQALKDYEEAIEYAKSLKIIDSLILELYLEKRYMANGLCIYFKQKGVEIKFKEILKKYMKDIEILYCSPSREYQSPQWNIDNALQPRVDLLKQMIKDLTK